MDSLARSGDVGHNGTGLPTCVGTNTTTRTYGQLGNVDIDSSGSDDVNMTMSMCGRSRMSLGCVASPRRGQFIGPGRRWSHSHSCRADDLLGCPRWWFPMLGCGACWI